jgi:hypothetical protein
MILGKRHFECGADGARDLLRARQAGYSLPGAEFS